MQKGSQKNMKILIDTNVILDVLCDRTDFVENSSKIWKLCEVEKIDGYISALSIPNIVYILRKELTPEKTQQIIEQLFMIFHIADLKSSDIRKAANMKTSDYEDAIQMVCAQRMKVDFIVTRNIKDFIESKVPAMKPDELLERREQGGRPQRGGPPFYYIKLIFFLNLTVFSISNLFFDCS